MTTPQPPVGDPIDPPLGEPRVGFVAPSGTSPRGFAPGGTGVQEPSQEPMVRESSVFLGVAIALMALVAIGLTIGVLISR